MSTTIPPTSGGTPSSTSTPATAPAVNAAPTTTSLPAIIANLFPASQITAVEQTIVTLIGAVAFVLGTFHPGFHLPTVPAATIDAAALLIIGGINIYAMVTKQKTVEAKANAVLTAHALVRQSIASGVRVPDPTAT